MSKKRLDQLIQIQLPSLSRNQITGLIMQGHVTVDGKVITKPGAQTSPGSVIDVKHEVMKYVSRAGFKLEKALDHFNINVQDFIVMDAGISTGGFTDCLLQRGAQKVYGVDVGYGQVHEKIRTDKRVIVIERTNLRELESLPEKVDLVTLDLAFISVLKVMPAVCNLLKEVSQLIVLVKPQFEATRAQVGRGGIIKDSAVHDEVIKNVTEGVCAFGFELIGVTDSPIYGSSGNKEFLAYFKRKPA